MPSPQDHLPDREVIAVRLHRIAFRRAGPDADEMVPVVFLHGLGGGSATWRRQYESLGKTRRVIGWEMPGYGSSDPLPGLPEARDYAECLSAFLSVLHLSRVHLVGQSVSALIAAAFAQTSPSRLRSLVFAHPLTGFGALSVTERAAAAEKRIRPFEDQGAMAFASMRGPRLLASGADPELICDVVATMAQVPPTAYRQAVMMMRSADLFAEADGIDLPALVVGGSEDPLAPPETCRSLAQALPAGQSTLIDRSGHYAALEQPAQFNSALETFFAAIEADNINLARG